VTLAPPDWSVPGCYAVSPGVHRIPLTMPQDGLRAVNVFALETARGLVLVDGGWRVGSALTELRDALDRIGRRPEEIVDVLVTHVHRDHYTLATALRREYGARIWLGRQERPGLEAVLELGSNVPTSSLRELRRGGAPALADVVAATTVLEPFEPADWELPDGWLDPGVLDLGGRRLEVVETPGHTKGHVVLHDLDAGLLFSGDHVLPTITPSIGFELGDWELPLGRYLASLELLLGRPDAALAPAHGHHGRGVHQRVGELLDHHAQRLRQTRDVLDRAGRPLTGASVADGLTWTRRARPLGQLDDFNQMIAICETLAHLDLLVAREEVAERDDSGVSWFVPTG
jgi:glyoxylase-like metal-dependent hydrolase (beta-lactamase superfamily II)